MFVDRFGPGLWSHRTRFIEPAWRTILNSKALLVVLWESFQAIQTCCPPAHQLPEGRLWRVKLVWLVKKGRQIHKTRRQLSWRSDSRLDLRGGSRSDPCAAA
jgi:hypothetical protein